MKTKAVWLKSAELKSFMRSAKPNVITHTSLDLLPHPPYSFSLFILHWICHSALKYSCPALKNECICRKGAEVEEREVSRFTRYSLMMKVTEDFESSRCFRKCGWRDSTQWPWCVIVCVCLRVWALSWMCASRGPCLHVMMWGNQGNIGNEWMRGMRRW